jgi:hypothetical protein
MTIPPLRLAGAITSVICTLSSSANGTAPTGRYTYPASGTVHDTKTGLTWQQTAPAMTYSWMAAKVYCGTLGPVLGGTGWRLPTVKELLTVVDSSQATSPAIDPYAFPGTPASNFWSLSPVSGSPSNAWYVDFSFGHPYFNATLSMYNVRCVR